MARGLSTCDNCGKPTNRVVMKLYLSPVNGSTRANHSKYTGHADIGECCAAKVTSQFKWQKRQSQKRAARA